MGLPDPTREQYIELQQELEQARAELESIKKALSSQTHLMNTIAQKTMIPVSEKMQIEIERLKSQDSFDLKFMRQENSELKDTAESFRGILAKIVAGWDIKGAGYFGIIGPIEEARKALEEGLG